MSNGLKGKREQSEFSDKRQHTKGITDSLADVTPALPAARKTSSNLFRQ